MSQGNGPIIGAFAGRADAEKALDELQRAGFKSDQLGMVVPGNVAVTTRPKVAADTAPEQGAAVGAVTGGTVGGLIGAVLATAIPGVGPVLAAGILAGLLGGATIGIAGGGLVGALIGLGLSHEEASYYENEFRRGRALVTVRADSRQAEAANILERCGAVPRQTATRA